MMFTRFSVLILALSIILTACTQVDQVSSRELKVVTHDSFAISEEVITQFEEQYGAIVQFIKAGDTGTALNKVILSIESPLGDVFYGVDNTFLSRALTEGIYEPYDSPLLNSIPDEFKLDNKNRALPVDFGDVCPNYDKAFFRSAGITPPTSLEDLLMPEYKGLLVVQNPATSSPGLAFMLATIGRFGEESYLDYWLGLMENDMLVVNDWESAYYNEFSVHGGTHPIVISYGSSPPAEVIFADVEIAEPPTGVLVDNESCFRQIEFIGILKGTQNRELAEKFIDFVLSPSFQEDMPMHMFVFPVNQEAQLPEQFAEFASIAESTAEVDPEAIAEKREIWLQDWTETVLR
jgi:thiamine transport system substrate-binding protein